MSLKPNKQKDKNQSKLLRCKSNPSLTFKNYVFEYICAFTHFALVLNYETMAFADKIQVFYVEKLAPESKSQIKASKL